MTNPEQHRTHSFNAKHPLWKIKVMFPQAPTMTELIKAPSGKAAVQYARNKYSEATVFLVGKGQAKS
jgi:hypothetical protein